MRMAEVGLLALERPGRPTEGTVNAVDSMILDDARTSVRKTAAETLAISRERRGCFVHGPEDSMLTTSVTERALASRGSLDRLRRDPKGCGGSMAGRWFFELVATLAWAAPCYPQSHLRDA
jgi:hypothetical protein